MRRMLDCLRGARRIEWFALAVVLAVLGMLLLNAAGARQQGPSDGTEQERRLAALLERLDGVGRVSVMIATDDDGAAEGAVVVCGRLDGIGAYLEIQSAVQALLDIEAERIRIIGANGFGGGL